MFWETCGPGHGKGPWDGIGAMVKRLLRSMELTTDEVGGNPLLNAQTSFDCFHALVTNIGRDREQKLSKELEDVVYHFIQSTCGARPDLAAAEQRKAEEAIRQHEVKSFQLLDKITRPRNKPTVTNVKGIRRNFCFYFAANNFLVVRELSCRCKECMEGKFKDCENEYVASDHEHTVQEGRSIKMSITYPSSVARSRSSRAAVSAARKTMAREAEVGTIVALQANEAGEQGYSFTLAKVVEKAFEYRRGMDFCAKSVRLGVKKKVGGTYIKVTEMLRDSANPTTFMFGKREENTFTFDAEAVVKNNVSVSVLSQKRHYENVRDWRKLKEAECQECQTAGLERFE